METKLEMKELVEKHTKQLSSLLAKHKQEIEELTKTHHGELLALLSVDSTPNGHSTNSHTTNFDDDVTDLLESPFVTVWRERWERDGREIGER